jgi:hypothetical protein
MGLKKELDGYNYRFCNYFAENSNNYYCKVKEESLMLEKNKKIGECINCMNFEPIDPSGLQNVGGGNCSKGCSYEEYQYKGSSLDFWCGRN